MTDQPSPPTPGQTVGPFFAFGLVYDGDSTLVPSGRADAVRLHGRVLDGEGNGVPDALVEVWQPDAHGQVVQAAGSLHRDGSTFTGWGRAATDRTGTWSFSTVVPGAAAPGRAPYFALAVFARGLVHRLFTRAYLPGADAPDSDPFLASLNAERRATLVAEADEHGFVFDIRLQGRGETGEGETVFLSYAGRSD